MKMVLGWQNVPDRPVLPQALSAPKRKAGCVYALCLVVSVVTIVALYVTSYRLDHVQFTKRLFFDRRLSSLAANTSDEIQIVGFLNKNGDHIKLESLVGKPQKGVLELRWRKNDSEVTPVHRTQITSSHAAITIRNSICSTPHEFSEVFRTKPFTFLPNYKNPCWYEPLVSTDIYAKNAFNRKGMKGVFSSIEEIYTKKMETSPNPQRLRCLPYFFIAGMPKCGSTDLHAKLVQHPDIAKPPMKEPHWWAKKRYGETHRTPIPFKDYIEIFDRVAADIEDSNDDGFHPVITGDSSVSTLWSNDGWYRMPENCGNTQEPKFTNAHYIRYHIPRARIIVILRDPTERLYSGYLYFQKREKSPDLFHEEVVKAIQQLDNCLNHTSIRACVYNRTLASGFKVRLRLGLYYVYIQEWLRVFPREQIFVLRLEDYSQDPLDTLNTVYSFLGLRQLSSEEKKILFLNNVKNARRQKDRTIGDMREDTKKLLNQFYHPYNQKLSILLHDPKYLWSYT